MNVNLMKKELKELDSRRLHLRHHDDVQASITDVATVS